MNEPTAVHCTSASSLEAVAQHHIDMHGLALRTLAWSFHHEYRGGYTSAFRALDAQPEETVRLADAIMD